MIFKLLVSLEKLSYGTPSVKGFEIGLRQARAMQIEKANIGILLGGEKSFAGFYIRL
jgi:hypothetical protein